MIPRLEPEDFLIIPDNDVDNKIWVNEAIIALEETQPSLVKYLALVGQLYGNQALMTGFMVFKVVEHCIKRNENGWI